MNGAKLKIIALLFMLIDHLGYFFPNIFPIWFRILGRISMPIFAFLLVEGFFHSKNILRYMGRMVVMGGIMAIVNVIIMLIQPETSITMSALKPNIFITMSYSLLLLMILDKVKLIDNNFVKINTMIAIIITFTLCSLKFEYGAIFISIILVFYFFRDNKKYMILMYIITSIIFSLLFSKWIQCFMVFAIIPIMLYNGQKGNACSKYFFYLFYPIHIYTLWLISILLT